MRRSAAIVAVAALGWMTLVQTDVAVAQKGFFEHFKEDLGKVGDSVGRLFKRPEDATAREPPDGAAAQPPQAPSPTDQQRRPNGAQSVGSPTVLAKPTSPSPQVREVQRLLGELGYDPGPADGAFGPRTSAAIELYQRRSGLPVMGRVTDELVAQLNRSKADLIAAVPAQQTDRAHVAGPSSGTAKATNAASGPSQENVDAVAEPAPASGALTLSATDAAALRKEALAQLRSQNACVRCELTDVDLKGANLKRARLNAANLSRANLSGAVADFAELSGSNLSGANLAGARLWKVSLVGADLDGANMRNAELVGAELRGAKLNAAMLNGADLREAAASKADLRNAHLVGVNLKRADLGGADLSGANLNGADLTGANLNGANLKGADLTHTNLSGVHLVDTSITLAILCRTKIDGRELNDGCKK